MTAAQGSRYPVLNPFSHAAGHLWITFPGGGPLTSMAIHLIWNGLMAGGLALMAVGWHRIHRARRELVTGEGVSFRLTSLKRAGLGIYSALGLGQVHYFYRRGAVVVWIAADPRIAGSALADAARVVSRRTP